MTVTRHDSFTADSIFAHLLEELDRPDCKTARQIVAKERTIYGLRMENAQTNPLNIRMIPRGRPCFITIAVVGTIFASIAGICGFASYLSEVADTSAARARELAASPSMRTSGPIADPSEYGGVE